MPSVCVHSTTSNRTGPSPDDLSSVEYLAERGLPVLFALTKADKLTATKRREAFAKTVKTLGIEPDQAIAFSSLKGDGREELLETLGSLLFPQGAEGDSAAEPDSEEDGSEGEDSDEDGSEEDGSEEDGAEDDDGAADDGETDEDDAPGAPA